jgi:peptidoglycan/xylan/chitin deacetylase (PgdA/CDA1 family)
MRRWIVALLAAVFAPLPAHAQDTVALTFDDLPSLTLLQSQAYVDYSNYMILHELRHHHMPAIGFVNEGKLDEGERARQIDDLKKWIKAGMDLGNHTFSHVSPNTTPAAAYIADIAKGEKVTRPLLAEHHKTLTWFRYPYLETGRTAEEKTAIQDWLKGHGYRIAPVTMENADWMFAEPYDDAIARHQDARVKRIRAEYLAYTENAVSWYQNAGHVLLGRPMAFVMLLHVTRLNADCMDDLAAILKRHRIKSVTLDEAMKDPAYQIADPYVGPNGIEWLERWSMTLHKDLPWASFKEPPADIEAEYKKIDNDL